MTRLPTSFLKSTAIAVLATATLAATPSDFAEWRVDNDHSRVGFTVNHFFSPVVGQFDDFAIELQYDRQNPANSTVSVEIQVSSVNTSNDRRDTHLKSGDFFAADENPTITFRSSSVTESMGHLMATGPLTIRGITKEVMLPIEILGVKEIPAEMRDMLGGATAIASFKAALTIDRSDFGVGVGSWAATLVVGGEVTIDLSVEAALK